MFQPSRVIGIAVPGLVVCLVSVTATSLAEPPKSSFDRSPESQQESRIRDALNGGVPIADSNDPILDDVLQLIKRRGSVLDGSSLDQSPDVSGAASRTQRAHAAEVLLKASRLLERVEPPDTARRELVNRMRGEAVKLLTE